MAIKKSAGNLWGLLPAKGPAKPDITLLVIGSRSCGKTALIYYLYWFAINYLLGRYGDNDTATENGNDNGRRIPDQGDTGFIRSYRYDEFIRDIIGEIKKQRDFKGTDPFYCSFMSYDFKGFHLNIYNLPGEWFTDANTQMEKLISFATHINNLGHSNIFIILCSEPVLTDKTFNDTLVRSIFQQHSTVAQNVLDNIGNNLNTIRVLTKFDQYLRNSLVVDKQYSIRQQRFEIYNQALDLLNDDVSDFYGVHSTEFATPHLHRFNSANGRSYYEKFFCTGLYNPSNPSDALFIDTDRQREFTDEHINTNLQRINMFGIEEIWYYILGSLDIAGRYPYFRNKDKRFRLIPDKTKETNTLTIDIYKKIIGIK